MSMSPAVTVVTFMLIGTGCTSSKPPGPQGPPFCGAPELSSLSHASGLISLMCACAVVESVKAASDVYAPLTGKVVETNQTIIDDPSIVNSDAEGEGWFFRIEIDDTDAFEALMDAAAYDEYVETLD